MQARPVRATNGNLVEGMPSLEGNYFVATYPPFSCWSEDDLPAMGRALGTAHRASAPPLGLYVHIPFCLERCRYCYYRSYAGRTVPEMERYLEAVAREATMYAATPALADRRPAFAYVGGGTPSLLAPDQIRALMRGLRASFSWKDVREVTFECAPKTVTDEKVEALAESGITRVSLGVQQLNDEVLRANGRVHGCFDACKAYAALGRGGFRTINIDLMVGLVGESDETFSDSLERILELEPESVTIYQLEVPRNTPLYRSVQTGALTGHLASWEIKRRRLAGAFEKLERNGYRLRSAYAAVRDVRHRFLYQDVQYHGGALAALGVASFAYLDGVHCQNVGSLREYLRELDAGRLPWTRAYALNEEERMVRELVLQLKLGGVHAGYFRRKFDVEIGSRFARPLEELASRGWLKRRGDVLDLTREGLLRVDGFLPAFYLPRHRHLEYWGRSAPRTRRQHEDSRDGNA